MLVLFNLPGLYFPGRWIIWQCLRDMFKFSNSTLHNLGGRGWVTITQRIGLLELSGHRV